MLNGNTDYQNAYDQLYQLWTTTPQKVSDKAHLYQLTMQLRDQLPKTNDTQKGLRDARRHILTTICGHKLNDIL